MSPQAHCPYHGPVHAKLTARTGPRRCGVGVRVSATARRGAVPYADGAQRLVGPRTHDCLPSLVRERLGPGGVYIEFCVRHNGTLPSAPLTKQLHAIAYHQFRKVRHHHAHQPPTLVDTPGWIQGRKCTAWQPNQSTGLADLSNVHKHSGGRCARNASLLMDPLFCPDNCSRLL